MKGKPKAPVGETRIAPLDENERRKKADRTRIGGLRDGRDPPGMTRVAPLDSEEREAVARPRPARPTRPPPDREAHERQRPGRETRAAPLDYDEPDGDEPQRPGRETRAAPLDYDEPDDDEPQRPGRETRAAPLDYDDDGPPRRVQGRRASLLDKELGATIPPSDPSVISSIPPIQETRVAPLELSPSGEIKLPNPGEVHAGRTTYSYQALLFADALRGRFAKKIYGRNPHRVARIDEPEGPSTAGGKLARQPVSLVPRKGIATTLLDRKSTRLNSSHCTLSRMPSSA